MLFNLVCGWGNPIIKHTDLEALFQGLEQLVETAYRSHVAPGLPETDQFIHR